MERGGERPGREAQRLRTPPKEVSRQGAESLSTPARPKAIPTRRRRRALGERQVVAALATVRHSTSRPRAAWPVARPRAAWPVARRAPLD
jgi:hypothetical protein